MAEEPLEDRKPRVVAPEEGPTVDGVGFQLRYRLRKGDGAGFSLIETRIQPDVAGPPIPHWHTGEDFVAYVLEGELRYGLGGGEAPLGAGSLLHLPRGSAFTWRNPGPGPARVLWMWCPAGFEGFFADVAAAVEPRLAEGAGPEVMREVIPPLWRKYRIGRHEGG